MKNKTITDEDVGFYKGYVLAVVTIIKTHGEDTIAYDVLKCLSTDLEQMKAHGVEESDLEVIRKLLKGREDVYKGQIN